MAHEQAEDGIRDTSVTGVQTCALPILQPIGMCGVLKRDGFLDIDLGYAFLPEFWSRGLALESASAVLNLVRSVLRAPRIIAFVSKRNKIGRASCRERVAVADGA